MNERTVILLGDDLEQLRRIERLISLVATHVYFYANDYKMPDGSPGEGAKYALYTTAVLGDQETAIVELAESIQTAIKLPSKYVRRLPEFITPATALRAFTVWLDTYYSVYDGKAPTTADVDHSALLARLMSGGKKLPIPAPTFHSYPCYSIGEGEPYRPHEVHDYKAKPGYVVIDQNGGFLKVDNQTVRYELTGELFRFDKPFPDGEWHYQSQGTPVHGPRPTEDSFLHLQKVAGTPSRIKYLGSTVKRNYRDGNPTIGTDEKEGEVLFVLDGGSYYKVKFDGESKESTVSADKCVIIALKEYA